jgi:hypothetical protein
MRFEESQLDEFNLPNLTTLCSRLNCALGLSRVGWAGIFVVVV